MRGLPGLPASSCPARWTTAPTSLAWRVVEALWNSAFPTPIAQQANNEIQTSSNCSITNWEANAIVTTPLRRSTSISNHQLSSLKAQGSGAWENSVARRARHLKTSLTIAYVYAARSSSTCVDASARAFTRMSYSCVLSCKPACAVHRRRR